MRVRVLLEEEARRCSLANFRNERFATSKSNPEHKRRMEEALEEVRQMLGQEYGLVINGERIKTPDSFAHTIRA